MQITTGAAITITGLIAGINIIGLFFAVWLMDRQSRHMQAYFFGAVLLGLKGVSEIGILTGILPISFQNASNVLDTAGLLLFARGVAWDFQLSGVVGKVSLVAAISMAAESFAGVRWVRKCLAAACFQRVGQWVAADDSGVGGAVRSESDVCDPAVWVRRVPALIELSAASPLFGLQAEPDRRSERSGPA